MAVNTNVGFRLGLQSSADAIIAAGTGAEEGSFYLTSDSHRLYIGAESETQAGQYTLYAVNEGVTTIATLAELEAIAPTTDAEKKACTGRFYYISEYNILAVYNGQAWVQINQDTDNSIAKVEITGKATENNNETEIKTSITDNAGNRKDGSINILTNEGIISSYDKDKNCLVISGDTYTLTSTVSSTDNAVTLHLASTNTTNESNVTIVGEDLVEVTQNENVITIKAEDVKITDVSVDDLADGMKITVTDSKGRKASGSWKPTIQYGGDETNLTKIAFQNGTATLDVYSTDEIDQLLRDLNGMTYKGTIGAAGSYGTGFRVTATEKWILDASNNAISSSIGDMVVLAEELEIGSEKYPPGTIVICRSSSGAESSTGFIAATDLEFDIIAANQNTDTTYKFTRLKDTTVHGFQMINNLSDIVGNLILKSGKLDNIIVNGEPQEADGLNILVGGEYNTNPTTGVTQVTLSVSHETTLVSHEEKEVTQEDAQRLDFDAISSIEVDDTGHIKKVVTSKIIVKDTSANVSEVQYATSAYLSSDTKTTVGVIKNTVTTEDLKGTKVSKDNSFVLTSKSLTISNDDTHGPSQAEEKTTLKEGLSIEMVWGSF